MKKTNGRKLACRVVIAMVGASQLLVGCNQTGACEGTEGIFDNTYCYSDFTEDECEDYDSQEVNGANWNFYEDQTCADRGCPGEGSC